MGPTMKEKTVCIIPYYSPGKENEDNGQPQPNNKECNAEGSGEIVKVSTIDEELIPIVDTRPFLINVDVEGYEFEVLKGSESFLRKFRPCFILVDVDHLDIAGTDHDSITKWLETRDYEKCSHTVDRDHLFFHRSCSDFASKLQECEKYD